MRKVLCLLGIMGVGGTLGVSAHPLLRGFLKEVFPGASVGRTLPPCKRSLPFSEASVSKGIFRQTATILPQSWSEEATQTLSQDIQRLRGRELLLFKPDIYPYAASSFRHLLGSFYYDYGLQSSKVARASVLHLANAYLVPLHRPILSKGDCHTMFLEEENEIGLLHQEFLPFRLQVGDHVRRRVELLFHWYPHLVPLT